MLVKPEGLQRSLAFRILGRFEERGLRLAALRLLPPPSSALLRLHYAHATGRRER